VILDVRRRITPMRKFATTAFLVSVFSGCVLLQEPYPGWTVTDISYEHLPRRVKAAFQTDFGDVRVIKVERSTFESRMSGHPRKFRLFFERAAAETHQVIYDEKGEQQEGFDFWFDEIWRTPNKKRNVDNLERSGGLFAFQG
jgi:hypothetical protein